MATTATTTKKPAIRTVQLDPTSDLDNSIDEILGDLDRKPTTAPVTTAKPDQAKAAAEAKAKRTADKDAAAKAKADAKAVKDADRAAKKAAKNAPPPPPAPGSIGHLLDTIPDPQAGETLESYTAGLAGQSHKTQIDSNLVRIKLGLALLADPNRPKVRAGVTAWMDAEAARLKIKPRMLAYILAAAKSINNKKVFATALQIPADVLLDRPLAKVGSAIKITIKGHDPDADKPKAPPKTAVEAVKSAASAILAKFNGANDADRASIIVTVDRLLDTLKA